MRSSESGVPLRLSNFRFGIGKHVATYEQTANHGNGANEHNNPVVKNVVLDVVSLTLGKR